MTGISLMLIIYYVVKRFCALNLFHDKKYISDWCRDSLFKAAMNISSTIIMFLPRNVDINQLAELALSTYPPWSLEASVFYFPLS